MLSNISAKATNSTLQQCSDSFENGVYTQSNGTKDGRLDSSDFVSTSSNRESANRPNNPCGNSQVQRANQTPSKEDSSTRWTQDETSLYARSVGAEHKVYTNAGKAPELLIKEQDLESEDELEEFVLQPRNSKQ